MYLPIEKFFARKCLLCADKSLHVQVPENAPKGGGDINPEAPDPATVQRWWTEHLERQRRQKKLTNFPPPPSETEGSRDGGNGYRPHSDASGIVSEAI